MDDSTERIIRYLREKYEVDINILFFNVFSSGKQRCISRVWFDEDVEEQIPTAIRFVLGTKNTMYRLV